jgi:hypothetical protein
VQRVDRREGISFPLNVEGFETRRLNFTFRYVPDEHVVPYASLPRTARDDTRRYMQELAQHSAFFERELNQEKIKS